MTIPVFFGPSNPVTPVLVEALGPTTSSNPDELLPTAIATPPQPSFMLTEDVHQSNEWALHHITHKCGKKQAHSSSPHKWSDMVM
jgi:hypothetical protein